MRFRTKSFAPDADVDQHPPDAGDNGSGAQPQQRGSSSRKRKDVHAGRGQQSSRSQRRRRVTGNHPLPHLDSVVLKSVYDRCTGKTRVAFGGVCKLWRLVRNGSSVHHVQGSSQLQSAVQEAREYDTIVIHPDVYKQRLLCSRPLRLIALSEYPPAAAGARDRPLCPVSSSSVVFWQERTPAILSNCERLSIVGVTLSIAQSCHQYSSVAFGPEARFIHMSACHVIGATCLRIPCVDEAAPPLCLSLEGCVITGAGMGLSGVDVASGQLQMRNCSVHSCTYGVEVQRDGHATLVDCELSYMDFALLCEGHTAMTRCHLWANRTGWRGPGVLVNHVPGPHPGDHGSRSEVGGGHQPAVPASDLCCGNAERCHESNSTLKSSAQLLLQHCTVDSQLLGLPQMGSENRQTNREARRLMRRVYGEPDQDYDDWQIVVMSDMDESDDGEDYVHDDADIGSDSDHASSQSMSSNGTSSQQTDGSESSNSSASQSDGPSGSEANSFDAAAFEGADNVAVANEGDVENDEQDDDDDDSDDDGDGASSDSASTASTERSADEEESSSSEDGSEVADAI